MNSLALTPIIKSDFEVTKSNKFETFSAAVLERCSTETGLNKFINKFFLKGISIDN